MNFKLCAYLSLFLSVNILADESDEKCGIILKNQQNLNVTQNDLSATFEKLRPKPKTSLSIIFDNTGSMSDDLDNLRRGAIQILDKFNSYGDKNPIENYILSVFNDPDVYVHETRDSKEFLKLINEIKIYSGYNPECPEMAFTGIVKALKLAQMNSFAYVFTDAGVKDLYMKEEVYKLIQNRQANVNILKTGGTCGEDPKKILEPFDDVVQASGGQFFQIERDDVDEVLIAIGSKLDENHVSLKANYGKSGEKMETELKIDSSIDKVSIIVSGQSPELKVYNSKNESILATKTTNKQNIIFLNFDSIDDPLWKIAATAKSSYSVIVDGKSQLKILFGFSVQPPMRISETFFQPLKHSQNHLSIFLSEPALVKCLTNVKLIKNDKEEYDFILIRRGDFYITELINIPSEMFKIYIYGYDSTGKKMERLISTSIEPSDACKYGFLTKFLFC